MCIQSLQYVTRTNKLHQIPHDSSVEGILFFYLFTASSQNFPYSLASTTQIGTTLKTFSCSFDEPLKELPELSKDLPEFPNPSFTLSICGLLVDAAGSYPLLSVLEL